MQDNKGFLRIPMLSSKRQGWPNQRYQTNLATTLGWLLLMGWALCLSSCSRRGHAADDKIHLRLAGYGTNEAEVNLVQELIDGFNRSHPKIEVSFEPVPGSGSQYFAKILAMLVSHTAPDVFYLDSVAFKPFLTKKTVLRPLNDLITKSTALKREDFIPTLMNAFSQGEQVYGIPKDFNTYGFYYNKTMFDQAGIPYPDPSWDLEKLREVSKQLTVHEGSKPHYGFALSHDDMDRFLPIAYTFGASLFSDDGRCSLASSEAEQAMNFYSNLKLVDHAAVYPAEVGTTWTGDAFGRQDVAMVFEGGWLIPYLKESFPDIKYGITELPKGPKGRSNFLFTVAYVIPQASTHVEAAWQLIEYLTSEETQVRFPLYIPSRNAASERFVEQYPLYKPILAGSVYGRPYDFGPHGLRARDQLGVCVQEVFLGVKSPAKALQDACHELDLLAKL